MTIISALKSPEQLWKIYLLVASITVLTLGLFMPPFEVNDEFQHFFRSYQVSMGIGIGRARGGVAGGYLPASLSQFVLDIVGSLTLYQIHPIVAKPLGHSLSFLNIPLNPATRIFTDFSATVLYAPLGYLPQAAGIWLARLLGAGPLACFYAARLANAVVSIVTTAFALRIAPFARYAIFFAAVLPTVLSLDGSVSQDAFIIASLFLFLSLCLKAYHLTYWRPADAALALAAGLIVSVSKLAYFPVVFLAFAPMLVDSRELLWPKLRIPCLMVLICALAAILWFVLSHSLMVWHLYHNFPAQQLIFVTLHPIFFIAVLLEDLWHLGLLYAVSATTMFVSWPPEIALPPYCFCLILIQYFMLLVLGDGGHARSARLLGLFILVIFTCGFSVFFLLYLSYEPVGAAVIEQAQGRHLIPIIPIMAILISILGTYRSIKFRRLLSEVFLISVIVNSAVLVLTIYQRYQLF